MDLAAVIGNQVAQIEQVNFDTRLLKDLLRLLHQPEGFRHLTRTGAVVARSGANQQHARRRIGILLANGGTLKRLVRGPPFV